MSKEHAAKVMQEIFSKGTYEGDLLGINEGRKMSDTPRTDVAEHNIGSVVEPHYVVDVEVAHDLERELAEAREELNDKRKFCYAVEQALYGMKGDYVEIIKELRKDAERYRWLRERHENTVMDIYNSISPAMIKPEMFDAAIDAAMQEGK